MKLTDLCKLNKHVKVDPDDLEKFGNLSAWIDDQGRIKVSLGSREKGKAYLHPHKSKD